MKVLTVRSKKRFLIIRILFCGFRVFGLAPFAVSGKTSNRIVDYRNTSIRAFRSSKIGLTYNLLLLILISVLNVFQLPPGCTLPGDLRRSRDIIQHVVSLAEQALITFAACVILAYWGFRQDNAASIMNRLLEVDAKLSGLKEQPFDKRTLIFLIIHVTCNGYRWIYLWAYILCYENFYGFFDSFLTMTPYNIVFFFIVEYFTIVGLVAKELQTVNKYLLKFEELGNYLPRLPVRSHVLTAEIFLTLGSNKLASLLLLRRLRTTLFELCGDIAEFTSLPILFSIASFFVSLLGQVYLLFAIIDSQGENYSITQSVPWLLTIFLTFIYPIVSLALNVTRTTTEARLTGHVVHKLLAVARRGSEIRRELKEFSLQLLHEHINFTAYGFFSLDSSIMQMILGGIATYFIVLIQFNSTCSCQSPTIAT